LVVVPVSAWWSTPPLKTVTTRAEATVETEVVVTIPVAVATDAGCNAVGFVFERVADDISEIGLSVAVRCRTKYGTLDMPRIRWRTNNGIDIASRASVETAAVTTEPSTGDTSI
jgi:hypothetical protein